MSGVPANGAPTGNGNGAPPGSAGLSARDPLGREVVWGGDRPIAPEFTVHGVTWEQDSAAPTLKFELEVDDTSGRDIFAIALVVQINIDAARRSYDDQTRERLVDLFGSPERWGVTTNSFLWSHATTLVPSFSGSTRFQLPLPCTYDLELAATKYLYGLPGGEVPLAFHFSGTIMHRGDDGQVQVVMVPWSCSTDWRMPIDTWREMMQRHYPNGSWLRVHADTLELLDRRKTELGLPSYDACVLQLLQAVEQREA